MRIFTALSIIAKKIKETSQIGQNLSYLARFFLCKKDLEKQSNRKKTFRFGVYTTHVRKIQKGSQLHHYLV